MTQSPNTLFVQTNRLSIEPLRPEDSAELFELMNDETLYTFVDAKPPASEKDLHARFETITRGRSKCGQEIWLQWVTRERATRQSVGYLEATIRGDEASVGIYTFGRFQGQGYAKEGLEALVERLPSLFTFRSFVYEADTRNRASLALAESLGFRHVSTTTAACTIEGHESHEFRFEKSAGPRCMLLTRESLWSYIAFRCGSLPDSDKRARFETLLRALESYTGETESIFVCKEEDHVLGSASLIVASPQSLGISNLKLHPLTDQKLVWKRLFRRLIDEASTRKAKGLEYRLIEDADSSWQVPLLLASGFVRRYHRSEFKTETSSLPSDDGTPLSWRALPDLSEESLKDYAALMHEVAKGDPDYTQKTTPMPVCRPI